MFSLANVIRKKKISLIFKLIIIFLEFDSLNVLIKVISMK